MAVIIELVNRSGHVLQVYKSDKDRIRIGRAFDNDIILHDDYADPYHAVITVDGHTHALRCMDVGAVNGVFIDAYPKSRIKKRKVLGASHMVSGETLTLGKSYLRVYSQGHGVEPAKALSSWEQLGAFMSQWWWITGLVIAIAFLGSLNGYLSLPLDKYLNTYLLKSFYPVLVAIGYAALWALVGKTLRNDGRFSLHLSYALSLMLVLQLYQVMAPILSFNFAFLGNVYWINESMQFILLFFAIWLAVTLATHLNKPSRAIISVLIPFALLVPAINTWLNSDGFQHNPPYQKTLVAPKWNIRKAQTEQSFIQQVEKAYQELDSDNE